MEVQNRIKELRMVKASELQANPLNWRTHPQEQRDALQGILAEVGFADALIARELEDGTLELIDGHLRRDTAPDAELPVLVTDLSEEEAQKVLLTLDPLAAMAGTNSQVLDALLRQVQTESQAVADMLTRLAEESDLLQDNTYELDVDGDADGFAEGEQFGGQSAIVIPLEDTHPQVVEIKDAVNAVCVKYDLAWKVKPI